MNADAVGQSWIRIDARKPVEGQECWYWFEVHKQVYLGKYSRVEYPGTGGLKGDQFYDNGGFLTDDVTYWMPKIKGDEDKPVPPTDFQRSGCLFHPLEIDDEEEEEDWSGMIRKSGRCDRFPSKTQKKKKSVDF